MAKQIKVSEKYWNGLRKFEQDYVRERAGIDGLAGCKTRIAQARKQHPDYVGIRGKGFIKLPDGTELLYSGDDTKTYKPF